MATIHTPPPLVTFAYQVAHHLRANHRYERLRSEWTTFRSLGFVASLKDQAEKPEAVAQRVHDHLGPALLREWLELLSKRGGMEGLR